MPEPAAQGNDIAIVGMAARLPGARTPAEFWANLEKGVESVRVFSDAELAQTGVGAEELSNPHYVKSGVVLEDFDHFDAEFFGFSPKEAAILDPQHRQFLECAWEALEDAGHVPDSFEGSIGVFGGCGMGAYFAMNLLTNRELVESVGLFLLRHTGNDKDFLTTRVSYCLNLRGPSVSVQTACSTSLVATHLACQSLLSGECDMALAGGVTIEIPHGRGYLYQPGEILSPDGHCRAFDHRAEGTIFGSGAGIVVLRRLSDALRDGDVIHAIIKGSAVNNDGAGKVGYLAPSVDGQAAAIAEALAVAGVSAESIGYVECHGTGTKMGDPIEIAALTQAFRQSTAKTGFCAIGSVKTNIGHLDTAAGVASLIKASLALSSAKIPPSLHYEAPNPEIDFAHGPFFVSRELSRWQKGAEPRRAGVNSLGVGGTNAYVVLEEPPTRSVSEPSKRPYQLLVLSARSRAALDQASKRLAEHLTLHAADNLADIAFTLQTGRRAFAHRRVLAARDAAEGAELLRNLEPRRVFTHDATKGASSVAFLFPGGGAQYPRMGAGLYESEPVFREWIDRGLEIAKKHVGQDLRGLIFPTDDAVLARDTLERPSLQLPAIFIVEYALSQLWMSWGIQPAALIGHSMGENAAACLSGVFRFEDCLGLVALRGRLMDEIESGGMLSVALPAADLRPLLGDLDLASINAPTLSVASGPRAALEHLERTLAERGVEAKWIRIHIAAHSRMLEPILPRYVDYLRSISLSEPRIPIVSNLTGTWLTREQAVDPEYWRAHLRNTVLFADGVKTLLEEPRRALLEVGPGKTLSSLARQHPSVTPGQALLSSLRHADEDVPDAAFFLAVFGRLWASGAPVDFEKTRQGEARRRTSVPFYPFQHQRYFIEPGRIETKERSSSDRPKKLADIRDWFYRPIWQPIGALATPKSERLTWLLFMDEAGLGERIADGLRGQGHEVITVRPSDAYYQLSHNDYRLSPEHGRDGYDALVRDLVATGKMPDRIAHLWLVAARQEFRPGSSFLHRNQERGFYSLLFLAQALAEVGNRRPMHIVAVSSGMQRVADEPLLYPDQATVLGPCKVIPRELEGVTCSSVDIMLPVSKRFTLRRNGAHGLDAVASSLLAELTSAPGNRVVVLRGRGRFEQTHEKVDVDATHPERSVSIREGGTYVITGGLGGIGLTLARHFAAQAKVNLVLVARSAPRDRKLEAVRDLEARGANVLIIASDVTDPEKMRSGLEQARRRFGKLHGVVHAAGVLSDELLHSKTQRTVESIFAPKIYGTLVLDSLVANDKLDFFVVFSSTSTVTGPPGQIDYVAANAFVNAYAQSRGHAKGTRTIALGWGIWNEVGMAAEAGRALGRAPAKKSSTARDGELISATQYSTRTHWVLDEHRTSDGQALLPGTAYLEMARVALAGAGETFPFEIRDLFFLRALAVADERQKEVRSVLRANEQGYDFEVQSRDDPEAGWELHAQAKLVLGSLGEAAAINLASIGERCQARTDRDPNGIASRQEKHLRFGRRWRVLREAHYGTDEALGTLELAPEFVQDLGNYQLHPALLDIATGFAMDLIDGYTGESLWVPVSYRSVRVRAALPARFVSWVRKHSRSGASNDFASFDVVLADQQGAILVEVFELMLRKLEGQSEFASAPAPTKVAVDIGRAMSPAELAFLRQLEQGILPAEGCQVFDRILQGVDDPVIIASSIDLAWLSAQVESAAVHAAAPGVKFARPDLETSYVAPRDEIERTLVGLWQELLGVEQVGVEDNFFDLGGHSLVAVRLFAKIKTTYRVDYPISILFEAPTVGRCAALIREAVGDSAARPHDSVDSHRTRFTHLVPMHPAASQSASKKTPFFLVAGMFGNVLNLRHLAHLIGQERPLYGLQARGLYGDHTPHESFDAMAADYITELRTVQPKGPYVLGGFSGGGITAYEMARQLYDQGEAIALLVLLDTPLPMSSPLTSNERWMLHVDRFRRRGPAHVWDWMKERYAWETHENRRRVNHGEAKRPFDFHSEAIEAAFRGALERYALVKMPFRVALFRPKLDEHAVLGPGRVINRERRFVYFDNGWGPYVDAVEVFEMPGDHDSMVLEPNVRVLAARLRECIEKAELPPAPTARPPDAIDVVA